MQAKILCVGTELLLGDVLDTNSKMIAEYCRAHGIDIVEMRTVGDNEKRIARAFSEMLPAELLIVTGGLGPTTDDLTKEVLARILELPLILDESAERYYAEILPPESLERNRKQWMLPKGAETIANFHGTAPGVDLAYHGSRVVLFPGVPRELRAMLPYLERYHRTALATTLVRIAPIGESRMNEIAAEAGLFEGTTPSVAPYTSDSGLFLKVTDRADEAGDARRFAMVARIEALFGADAYGRDDDTLEGVLVKLLTERGLTVTTAESITGGLVASRIVSVPGASAVLQHADVVYSDEAKIRYGVDPEILGSATAVSELTVRALLSSSSDFADVAIATSGYAGPDGDVGRVFYGARIRDTLYVKRVKLSGGRNEIRERTATLALDLARRAILADEN